MPLRTKTLHTNFQVDRTNGRVVIAVFFVTAPPSGRAAQFFFIWPKNVLINMNLEFSEDISFRSRVIAFFVKLALDFRRFWGPIAKLSRNFNFFWLLIFTFQRIFLQWFRSDRVKNLGLVRKSRFRISLYFNVETGPPRPQITVTIWNTPWPKDSKYVKILSLRQAVWELWALSRFWSL